ncbi:MAG TPA: GntR family transcriptional regulator [Hyphomicrobiaceae bacterium]|nr:GntR family transcriptional regulator [Hyphomicrobiaceae bacterium]
MSRTSNLAVARDTPTLRELTTAKLRDAILSLHFKPDQHLVERELCEETGVSRTSVREALRQLEAEGLVERRGNRGLFVSSITTEEARQIYEVRAALEPEMARLFAERADARDLEALEGAFRELEKAGQKHNVRAYVSAYDRFYDVLLHGSGNELARRFLATLRARITFLRTITAQRAEPAYREQTMQLMRQILEAALARNGQQLARRCRSFVERSAKFAETVLCEKQARE